MKWDRGKTAIKRGQEKRTFIIRLERVLAPATQLAAREWLILRGVSHSRHVKELDLDSDGRRTGRPARGWVVMNHVRANSGVFGHSIPVQVIFEETSE